MAEAFNEHFTNIAQVLAQEVPVAEVNPEFYLSYTDKAFCQSEGTHQIVTMAKVSSWHFRHLL